MIPSKKTAGNLRIIAGKWRRRRIRFDSKFNIRPTTDAARETLFNWLQEQIEGSICLDLFAGSGALGFEALSRGAKQAVLVDSNRRCIRNLHQNIVALGAENCQVVHSNALTFLRKSTQQFDLIFVDPPFRAGLATDVLNVLQAGACLNPGAQVYLEVEREFDHDQLAVCWEVLRQIQAGSRSHCLLASKGDSSGDQSRKAPE